jgi:UDPglucose 6-dehydrogenase
VRISVIGSGYVGIVSAACLAEAGHTIVSVDTRREVVSKINRAQAPIFEEGLDELLGTSIANKRLCATTDTRMAVLETDATLVCVGTPTTPSGIDLAQVTSACETIGSALAEKSTYHVVAVKSTVLPGTTEGVVRQTLEKKTGRLLGKGWGLAMNPEFLREGRAVHDFQSPDRIVIGAVDSETAELLLEMYASFHCPKIVTSPRTAEMIKYTGNALLATLISFSNEVANICKLNRGINAADIWRGVHLDRRLISSGGGVPAPVGLVEYLWHGLGFGGSCFPKDVTALQCFGKALGAPTPILDAVLRTNADQPLQVITILEREMPLHGKSVAVLGIAFKPGTDDLRESPALRIVKALRYRGAAVTVHDPVAMQAARSHPAFDGVTFAADWRMALKGADACCVVTAWPEYRSIPVQAFVELMRSPLVIDGRGIFQPELFAAAGAKWRGIGYTPDNFSPLCVPIAG